MGTSTNAILFFGFDFCDQDSGQELPFKWEDGWETAYAARKGLVDTSGLFTPEGEYAVPEGAERDRRDQEHSKYTQARWDLARQAGAEIDYHCHSDYPIYYVACRVYSASRGSPQKLDLKGMDNVTPDEIQKLREFCDVMGIEWKEPGWVLASYWG